MENASRALIMAATIILAMLLVGIFVAVFRAGSSVNESYDKKQQGEQLELYNSKFELYDKNDNTIMDLITVCNLAYSINEDTEYDPGYAVNIEIELGPGKGTFKIPETKKINPNNPNSEEIEKNTIFFGSDRRSIYELATGKFDVMADGEEFNDVNLANTKLESSGTGPIETIYQFIFKRKEMEYNTLGRINKMTFQIMKNPDY